MPFQEKLPDWHAEGVEPPESKRNTGWEPGERPPAEYWNWQMNRTYKVLQELQQKAAEKVEVQQAQQTANEAKDIADAVQSDLSAHASATTGVHGATSAATPNTIVQRDQNANISIGNATADNHALNRITADGRYAQKDAVNEFTANQIFTGNFPIIMQGRSAEDVPGKRTYRFDVHQDLLRIQALDDNYQYLHLILDVNHDGTFLRLGDTPYIFICRGAGSPEGNVFSTPGSIYLNTNGGDGTTLYVKRTGTGNTGWYPVA